MENAFPPFHELLYHSLRLLCTQEVYGEGLTECALLTGNDSEGVPTSACSYRLATCNQKMQFMWFWQIQTYFWHLFSKSTLREAHVVKTCSVRKETSTSDIPASRKPDHIKDCRSKPSRHSQCHDISNRRPLPGSLYATDDRYLCRTTTRLPTTTVFLKQRICLPTPSARTWFTS